MFEYTFSATYYSLCALSGPWCLKWGQSFLPSPLGCLQKKVVQTEKHFITTHTIYNYAMPVLPNNASYHMVKVSLRNVCLYSNLGLNITGR